MVDQDKLKQSLENQGYRVYCDYLMGDSSVGWLACKTLDTERRCECNSNKSGITVSVRPFQFESVGDTYRSATMDIRGEYGNGQWWVLEAYSLPWEDLMDEEGMKDKESSLLRAWEAL